MSTEQNKATVRRIVNELWNRADLSAAGELFAPQFSRDGEVLGPAGVQAIIGRMAAAQPDFHWTIDAGIAEGATLVLVHTRYFTHPSVSLHRVFGAALHTDPAQPDMASPHV